MARLSWELVVIALLFTSSQCHGIIGQDDDFPMIHLESSQELRSQLSFLRMYFHSDQFIILGTFYNKSCTGGVKDHWRLQIEQLWTLEEAVTSSYGGKVKVQLLKGVDFLCTISVQNELSTFCTKKFAG